MRFTPTLIMSSFSLLLGQAAFADNARMESEQSVQTESTKSVVQTETVKKTEKETVSLPRIDVSGLYEQGLGPVDGYYATRSVTAAKVDIPLIETPQAVSIVTAAQIEKQNAESLGQALKYTPGVMVKGSDNTTSDGLHVRGFNLTGSAPFYLNGSKLSRNTFSGVSEPYGLERLEVLKGPASVLYGNAAPGGIVNMVTKQPQAETLRELKLQAGSFDRKQLAGDFAGKITEDGRLSYRLTGLFRRSDTMTDYVPDDRDFGAFSVRWDPTEATSLTLLSQYQNNDTAYVYGLPEQGTVLDNINGDIDRDRFVGEPGFNKFETRNHTLGYLFSHQINDVFTFRQNLTYFSSDTDYNDIFIGALQADQRTLPRGAYARQDEDSSLSLDNQLQAKWQAGILQHTMLVGADYSESTFKRQQNNGTVAPLDIFNPQYGSPVNLNPVPGSLSENETEQFGVYAQEHLKIGEHWVVMLGGRFDKVKAETDNFLTNTRTENYDDEAFTGRAGLIYLFDNGFAPYFSYAESFQPTGGLDASGQGFDPSEGDQFEVGLRYQPEQLPLSVTASVYRLKQSNVTTADLANPGFSVQEGEVVSKGFELEMQANLTDGLNLIASYGYIDNEITESNNNNVGNRLDATPRHTASLWADYNFNGLLQGLGLGAGVRYIDDTVNIANTYDVDDYTVVDAVIDYQLTPEVSLAVNVNNLLDEEYATCSYACFWGVRRSAVATATYNW